LTRSLGYSRLATQCEPVETILLIVALDDEHFPIAGEKIAEIDLVGLLLTIASHRARFARAAEHLLG
jgi:hypothetical protein